MNQIDESATCTTNIDYAHGLSKFSDPRADYYFQEAIGMRAPPEGVEAHYSYAMYLRDAGRPEEAFDLLNRFTSSDRQHYLELSLLRQELAHALGIDTSTIDDEVDAMRESLSGTIGIGPIPKLTAKVQQACRRSLAG